MRQLLRADLYRLLKSKLTLVSLILAAVMPLLFSALFLGLKEFVKFADPSSSAMIELALNGHTLVASTFSLTNNIGIILPVFATIFVMNDLTSGTIRNKVILGHSRHKIFASSFLCAFFYCAALIAIYAAMTALWGGLILGFGEISEARIVSLVYFYILGLAEFAFVSAAATCLPLLTLNSAASVLLTILVCLSFGLLSSIIAAFDYSSFAHVANFIPGFVATTFQMKEIDLTMFLEGLAGTLLFALAFYLLGTFGFNKRDLK